MPTPRAAKRKKEEFLAILTRQGISVALGLTASSIRSTAQRLLKITENELEVRAWHNGLSEAEKIAWASPTAIYKWCPVFQRKAELDGAKEKDRKPTPTERIKELEAQNAHLQDELASTIARQSTLPEPMWRDDLNLGGSAKDIAAAIIQEKGEKEAENIAVAILTTLNSALASEPEPAKKKRRRKKATEAPAPEFLALARDGGTGTGEEPGATQTRRHRAR